MSDTYLLYGYAITKMTKGQRKALLAAVDGGGRLPDGVVSARVLESIPEAWARTDEKTGSRLLTREGRAALITIDRYRHLRRANPETSAVYGLNHAEGQGMSRDGLVIFQSRDGRITEATESWRTLAAAYITERGRKLVGMPLIAPPFAARLPVGSRAVWVREGKPDMPVEVKSWQLSDGAVLVHPLADNRLDYRETEAPATELHPC